MYVPAVNLHPHHRLLHRPDLARPRAWCHSAQQPRRLLVPWHWPSSCSSSSSSTLYTCRVSHELPDNAAPVSKAHSPDLPDLVVGSGLFTVAMLTLPNADSPRVITYT